MPGPESAVRAVRIGRSLFLMRGVVRPTRQFSLELVRIGGGQIVAVHPPEVAPLVAVTLTEPKTGGPDRIRTGDLVLDRDVC